jgi:hypothetical protein
MGAAAVIFDPVVCFAHLQVLPPAGETPDKYPAMKSPTCALRAASVIFGLMGLAHLVRIFLGLYVQIGSCSFGRRWSLVAFVILAALSVWFWLAAAAAAPKTEAAPTKPAS